MWQYNYSDEYLCHWGVKGMKWGVRRFQNEDGTLTPAGKIRYAKEQTKKSNKAARIAYKKYSQLNSEKRQEISSDLTETEKQTIVYGAKKNLNRSIAIGSLVGGPIGGALASWGSMSIADVTLKDIGFSSKDVLSVKNGKDAVDKILSSAESAIIKIEKKDDEWTYIVPPTLWDQMTEGY